MGNAAHDRLQAADLPEGDVIRLLLEQHARIRDLFVRVKGAQGKDKQRLFDELRALLAVHETAEEMVLRPVSADAAGATVADARNHEEAEANKVLADLEKLDVSSPEFDTMFAAFQQAVEDHADAEERQEFPHVVRSCDETQRHGMGTLLRAAEAVAPTHPHPSTAGSTLAQYAAGPFASLIDRTRDTIRAAMR